MQNAAGNPEPAHERVLRRGDEKEAVVLVGQDVRALGEAGVPPRAADVVPHVQRKPLPFGDLFRAQLLPVGYGPILRLPMDVVRPGRHILPTAAGLAVDPAAAGAVRQPQRPGERRQAPEAAAYVRAAEEPLQVLLLFFMEIFHGTHDLALMGCG